MKKIGLIGMVASLLLATQMGATELTIVPLTGAEQSTAIESIGSSCFRHWDTQNFIFLCFCMFTEQTLSFVHTQMNEFRKIDLKCS